MGKTVSGKGDMGIRSYTRSLLVLLIAATFADVRGADLPGDSYGYGLSEVVRTSGNQMYLWSKTWATGIDCDDWFARLENSKAYLDDTLIGGPVNIENQPPYDACWGVANWHYRTISTYGVGTYKKVADHKFKSRSIWGTVSIGSTVAYMLVQRPTISGLNAIWWLNGGSDPAHGYYNQALLTADPKGAPETPAWTVTANPGKISLSCSVCTSNTATAEVPSDSCAYDIRIKVSVGGLDSDEFLFMVNRPQYLSLASYSPNPQDLTYLSGFSTKVRYHVRDLCNYLLSNIDLNEQFTYWIDDESNDWPPVQAMGWSFQEPPYTFFDNMLLSCAACTPKTLNPQSPLSSEKVQHGGQIWRIGSKQVGTGVQVHANTQQWYVDHGRHQ